MGKTGQDGAKMGQDTAKSPPRGLGFTHRAAPKKQRKPTVFQCFSIFWGFRFQDAPKMRQDRPREAQDEPREAQDEPRSVPRWARIGPRWRQDGQDGGKTPNPRAKHVQKSSETLRFFGCFEFFWDFASKMRQERLRMSQERRKMS